MYDLRFFVYVIVQTRLGGLPPIYLNTLLDKYIPKGRSANGTQGPMQGTPPIRHITHRTYK